LSAALQIRSHKYLPIRTLPLVSSGVLDTETVIDMVCDPEGFCDALNDTILRPYVLASGSLSYVPLNSFKRVVSKGNLPAGVVVQERSARAMFNLCIAEGINSAAARAGAIQTWNLDVFLPLRDRKYVFDGLPKPRKNSTASALADIAFGVQQICRLCTNAGMPIDPQQMPGTALTWHHYISELGCLQRPLAATTFKDHMKQLGYRWPQGRQHVRDAHFVARLDQLLANQCQAQLRVTGGNFFQ